MFAAIHGFQRSSNKSISKLFPAKLKRNRLLLSLGGKRKQDTHLRFCFQFPAAAGLWYPDTFSSQAFFGWAQVGRKDRSTWWLGNSGDLHSTHLKAPQVKNYRITALVVGPHVQHNLQARSRGSSSGCRLSTGIFARPRRVKEGAVLCSTYLLVFSQPKPGCKRSGRTKRR